MAPRRSNGAVVAAAQSVVADEQSVVAEEQSVVAEEQSVVAEESEGGESEQAESGVSVFSASSSALSSTSRDRRVCAAAEPEGDYESVVAG